MQFKARFFDGESLEPKHVVLGFDQFRLIISTERGQILSAHPLEDIILLYADRLGNRIDLGVVGLKDHRLMVEAPDVKNNLSVYLPQVAEPPRGEGWAAGFKVTAFLFVFVAFAALIFWQLERILPAMIPEAYVQEFGAGLADTYIGEFGGHCEASDGVAALQAMVGRLTEFHEMGQTITVRVSDNEEVNAFAVPGGQIVIFRGLLDKAASADEVAGVLAHEMGHVRHTHALRGLTRAIGLGVIASIFSGGDATQIVQQLIQLGFSRGMEEEADQEALLILASAEVDPLPLAGFFDRLSDRASQSENSFMAFMATHPVSSERSDNIRAAAGNYHSSPVLTDQGWQALKNICPSEQ